MKTQLTLRVLAVIAWIAMLCSPALGATEAVAAAATVQISTDRGDGSGSAYSGICVSPDGVIVTSEHCGTEGRVWVAFRDGTKVTARCIYDSPVKQGIDEAKILKLDHGPSEVGRAEYPFAMVSTGTPPAGSPVHHKGYPGMKWIETSGEVVVAAKDYTFCEGLVGMDHGSSGGPLFNDRWEVVGVCSGGGGSAKLSDNIEVIGSSLEAKRFVSLISIRKALAAVNFEYPQRSGSAHRMPRMFILGTHNCGWCDKARSETPNGPNVQYANVEDHPEVLDAFRKSTGVEPEGYPIYWVEGTNHYQVGYQPRRSLLGWLAGTVKGLGELIFGSPSDFQPPPSSTPPASVPSEPKVEHPGPPAMNPYRRSQGTELTPPPPQVHPDDAKAAEDLRAAMESAERMKTPPPKPTEKPLDWGGVRVIVAASDGVPKAAKLLEGPAKRAIERVSGGKAEILVIAQSTHPDAFAEYVEIMGVTPSPMHLTVLVPKTDQGLFKGLFLKKVEASVSDYRDHLPENVRNIPVEEIFERLNGEDYAALRDIAVQADAERESGSEGGPGLLHLLLGLFGSHPVFLAGRGLGRKITHFREDSKLALILGKIGG